MVNLLNFIKHLFRDGEMNFLRDISETTQCSRKAQSQTRQILCHRKKFYYRTVKSLRTGRSCGKIDAAVFKQFWNLSGLSLGHNQLEIIYERQKMMLTRRNWKRNLYRNGTCKEGRNGRGSTRAR